MPVKKNAAPKPPKAAGKKLVKQASKLAAKENGKDATNKVVKRQNRPYQLVEPASGKVIVERYPAIDRIIQRMRDIRRDGVDYMALEKELVELYRFHDLKSYEGCTLVESDNTTYDHDAIIAALPPKVAKQVTKRVLDMDALNGAIKSGLVDAKLVKKHTTTTPKKPFVTGMTDF